MQRANPSNLILCRLALLCGLGFLLMSCNLLQRGRADSSGLPNLELPTLGGRQFWADVAWSAGWRVQEHVWTGHCRLLDPDGVRMAWGAEEACCAQLPPQEAERVVVLLHGLGRTRFSFDALKIQLEQQGHTVVSLAYPSTRASIDEHAEHLERLFNRLDGVREASFVTHSLGGRVALRLFELKGAWMNRIRVERLLQLAPPNRGSSLANQLSHAPLIASVMGPAFMDLTHPNMSMPPGHIQVGVIAGRLPAHLDLNPFLAPGNDGVVTVEETRPRFPHEFREVTGAHTFLMSAGTVFTAARAFLSGGRLADNAQATHF